MAYLLQLRELELIERERQAAERRLKTAKFPGTKTLDEFDFRQQPSLNKPLVLELAIGQHLDAAESCMFFGRLAPSPIASRLQSRSSGGYLIR